MKNYLFFLSYARDDRDNDQDNRIERFYRDLVEYVHRRAPGFNGEIGFFDTRSTTTADLWTPEADQALRTCKVFVSVYSPVYFTRDYCGQEWQLFQTRLDDYKRTKAGRDAPSLIMPVLLVGQPLLKHHLEELPETISDVVYCHNDDPNKYIEDGLETFMLDKYRDDYKEFVSRFANRLIELSQKHPLPERFDLPSVKRVHSAFLKQEQSLRDPASLAQNQTPDRIEFFFVAGRRSELLQVRRNVGYYGEDGPDWKPYEPLSDEKIGSTAQRIAIREKFMSYIASLDDDLIEKVREARRRNRIVAIVVDSWTLRLSEYTDFVRRYDEYDFLNSVMLICWNDEDEETKDHLTELKRVVGEVFQTKIRRGVAGNFWFPVSTSEELEGSLVESLNKIRMDLLNFNLDAIRLKRDQARALAGADAQEGETKPINVMPSITGPGGA